MSNIQLFLSQTHNNCTESQTCYDTNFERDLLWYQLRTRLVMIPTLKMSHIVWSNTVQQINHLYLTRCICNNGRKTASRWRHNGRDGVSNHQTRDCLLILIFRRRSKKASKPCVNGLCAGNSPVTGEFPAQKASSAENVSIWWRHHDTSESVRYSYSQSVVIIVRRS